MRSKYETHVEPYLDVIKAWARNGVTDEEIWTKLGIGRTAFYAYQNKYEDFANSLKTNKDIADMQVENALFDEAVNGRNITAMIFWLKNRKPNDFLNCQIFQ